MLHKVKNHFTENLPARISVLVLYYEVANSATGSCGGNEISRILILH